MQQAPVHGAAPHPSSAAPHGYDLKMRFVRASNLPKADTVGGADPFLSVNIVVQQPAQLLTWQSSIVHNCLDPEWGETMAVYNLPKGAVVMIDVWDKDSFTDNDLVAQTTYVLSADDNLNDKQPQQQQYHHRHLHLPQPQHHQQQQQQQSTHGQQLLTLALQAPPELAAKQARAWRDGQGAVLQVELSYSPSGCPGAPCIRGPVRFRQHLSLLTGALAGNWTGPDAASFSTYKVYLHGIDQAFHGKLLPYDVHHFLAKKLFVKPLVCRSKRAAHASLYSTRNPKHMREGWLHNAHDLFELLGCYNKGRERSYFTYVLSPDALRFSQTGAAYFKNKLSKHAVHANCEDAVCAGEFCVFPKDEAPPDADAEEQLNARETSSGDSDQEPLPLPPPRQAPPPPTPPQQQRLQGQQVEQPHQNGGTQQGGQAGSTAGARPAFKLVIDNNSGTFSPPGELLAPMRALLLANFPGLVVETLDVTDAEDGAKLKWYHQQVPSRISPTAKQQQEEEQDDEKEQEENTCMQSPAQTCSSQDSCSSDAGTAACSSEGSAAAAVLPGERCGMLRAAVARSVGGRGSVEAVSNTELPPVGPHAMSALPTF